MSFAKPATPTVSTEPSSQTINPIVPDLYDPSKIPSIVQTLIIQMNDLSRNMDSMNLRMDNVELRTRNIELQTSLDTALDRIKELEATAAAAPIPHTIAVQATKETDIDPPPVPATPETESVFSASSPLRKLKLVSWFGQNAPSGFRYIYLRYSGYQGRQKYDNIRKYLCTMGVQINRVKEINDVDRDVISLLVHEEYAPLLIAILAGSEVRLINESPRGVQNLNKVIRDCAKITQKINYV